MDVVFLGWFVLAKITLRFSHFTHVLAVPGYMLRPKKIYLS